MTVLLRSDNYNAETGALERTVALPDGEWTINIRKNWIFTFENELKTPTPHLKNEAVIVNQINPKGGS